MERHGKKIAAVVLGLAAVGLGAHALLYPFITDDAYISFRYAHNLAYHGELSFNLGDRVEGYTNFLWTVVLGLLLKVGLRPDITSRVLGFACGVAVMVLVYLLTRIYRGGRRTGWDLLGAAMLAASANFAVWCSGGLETQAFSALALGGITLYVAEHTGRVRWRMSGLVFALAAMTRPEGMLLFGLTGLHHLGVLLLGRNRVMPLWCRDRVQTRRRYKVLGELGWVAGFMIPFGLYFIWRYSYYGYPFPNTYYIKAGGGASASITRWGLPYLWDFIKDNRLYVLPALLPLFWPRTTWKKAAPAAEADAPADAAAEAAAATEAAAAAAAAAAAEAAAEAAADQGNRGVRPLFFWTYLALIVMPYSAYVVYVGGDFMTFGRFFVPLLPLLMLFTQEALRETVERPRRAADDWRPLRMTITAALVLGLLVFNSVLLYRQNQKLSYYRWGLDTIAYLRKFADDRILVGTWMRHNLPRDTYLAVGGAGAIVYASQFKSLDTFGLNDKWIAHETPRVGDRPGHTKSAPDHYILQQKPDILCHQAKTPDYNSKPGPGWQVEMWRDRGYGWICIDPSSLSPAQHPPELDPEFRLRPSYYCCLKRLDKKLGPFPRVTQ